jgi:hypothetical protein
MDIGNTSYRLCGLVRTIRIQAHDWGVRVCVSDKSDGSEYSKFASRNFFNTKNYPTIEDNIKRGMKYYRAPEKEINYMLTCYKLKN